MQSYDCKQVPFDLLHAKKMAEVVLLSAFIMGFQASLLHIPKKITIIRGKLSKF